MLHNYILNLVCAGTGCTRALQIQGMFLAIFVQGTAKFYDGGIHVPVVMVQVSDSDVMCRCMYGACAGTYSYSHGLRSTVTYVL